MNPVLASTKYVVDNSKRVKINTEKIPVFAKTFTHEHKKHWFNAAPFDFTHVGKKEKLHFFLMFNSMSFSYWGYPKWIVDYQGQKLDGSWAMIAALQRMIVENKTSLNPSVFANLDKEKLKEILRANVEIPLLDERLKVLNEVGSVLTRGYDADFGNFVECANGDALRLLNMIVTQFPSFNDVSMYIGKKVYFWKRAQLLVGDIFQAFDARGYGDLKNVGQLTACADYKLPRVLRELDILEYSKELSARVDKKIILPHDCEEEIEIRANTIWAVELIKQKIQERIPDIDSIHVNDHLWLASQIKSPETKPHHLTRTTAY
ncbi:hypothetical protein HY772_02270 [Candidatus Woesearchaeota archaeon]|nr:hypothetical protein [Candidatus Woesearchaeota archaeon]